MIAAFAIVLLVLAGTFLIGFSLYAVWRANHDKLERDGHLRLPGYDWLTNRWSDEDKPPAAR